MIILSKVLLSLIIYTVFVASVVAEKNERYLLLQELTRHGHRYPFLNIMNSTTFTQDMAGELAPIGRASHYILGKNIKAKYPDVFDHKFSPGEIFIRSTGYNRTITSAMAHVQGIFDSFEEKP